VVFSMRLRLDCGMRCNAAADLPAWSKWLVDS
jgi:hypothetical protein